MLLVFAGKLIAHLVKMHVYVVYFGTIDSFSHQCVYYSASAEVKTDNERYQQSDHDKDRKVYEDSGNGLGYR